MRENKSIKSEVGPGVTSKTFPTSIMLLFSDESKLNIFSSDGPFNYKPKTELEVIYFTNK